MSGWLRAVFLRSLCIVAVGCRKRNYTGPARFPLSGKVTFDGEVVDTGTISFLPTAVDNQRVSGGVIEGGTYTIPEEKGANEGKYRVEIRWAKRTGKRHFDGELKMMVDERKGALPPRFHKQSELTVEVSSKQTSFDFDLKSK